MFTDSNMDQQYFMQHQAYTMLQAGQNPQLLYQTPMSSQITPQVPASQALQGGHPQPYTHQHMGMSALQQGQMNAQTSTMQIPYTGKF